MNRVIMQHYVPQFHLRGFNAPGTDYVYCFDKRDNHIFPTNPRNIGAENDFYLSGRTSDLFTKLEEDTAPIYQKIIQEENLDILNETERLTLIYFIVSQILRTREYREFQKQLYDSQSATLLEALKISDWKLVFSPEFQKGIQIDRLIDAARYAVILSGYCHYLGINRTSLPLITSDNPVTKANTFYGKFGLASPGIEIHFPITPRLCITLFDSSLTLGPFHRQ